MPVGTKEIEDRRFRRIQINLKTLMSLFSYPQNFRWHKGRLPIDCMIVGARFVPDPLVSVGMDMLKSRIELTLVSAEFSPVLIEESIPFEPLIVTYPDLKDRDGNQPLYRDLSYLGNCSAYGDSLNREIKGTKPHWE